ncbi:alpha/beta hydrolase [Bradyrhizobium sp. AUGA SZCCT0222]|uniref:alpha/beta fold hydrolase n=1 Tax=Bradyrhizobium sp. AUGA SZCCT0222 TaxID=2807668 RepID=UPI001BAB9063|nr:alpha/beta hydrolase [Bradyrhizobium sp. AUGA SZCCT0222]MBR1269693.1 alpha/beta hydrolase [Bradyrhizobium sp. AUGA SZCCT0222]
MASVLDRTKQALEGFQRQEIDINGITTVVYSAGIGEPMVYLHGSGTFTGFGFARQWIKTHRVILPYHPGFGESADDSRIESIQDYVLHYLDLFDALGLEQINLVGSSLGGWIASEIAIMQPRRIARLVLVSPGGLIAKDLPSTDLFSVPPKDLAGYLVADPAVLTPFMPEGHDLEFMTLRYRETTSSARLTWERPGNAKLGLWLHRITSSTLLLWGEGDRVKPLAQANVWLSLLPNARLEVMKGVGHLPLDEQDAAADIVLTFLKAEPGAAKAAASITGKASKSLASRRYSPSSRGS